MANSIDKVCEVDRVFVVKSYPGLVRELLRRDLVVSTTKHRFPGEPSVYYASVGGSHSFGHHTRMDALYDATFRYLVGTGEARPTEDDK
jgi:hypothetical protein